MSDFEQVQIDPKQFGLLEQRLNGFGAQLQIITERLGPVNKDKSIQKTLEDGFALIADGLRARGDSSKLDAIIEMLRAQAGVSTDLMLVKEELSLIHGLVAELASGGDPERVKQITANLKNARERLQTAIESQKGDPNG